MAILKEVMTSEATALLDTDAHNKAIDADAALQELGSDLIGQAYVTATVTVWDEEARVADEKLRLVEKVIQGRDFTAIIESINAVEAWLGSLPGHVYANVRQPPVSTMNLAHMIPLSAVWAGPERNEHLGGPPLMFAKTEGATPFRLSLHVGDVGHTLVIGPTGAGKSVLLALMALQFRRYPRSQIFAFDFGGSIRAAALAMGGDWHDLGGALSDDAIAPVALQPLVAIDDDAERSWAAQWVAAILAREGVVVTPEAKGHVWSALSSLASAPAGERTLTGPAVLLQSGVLKRALQPYCLGGPWGRLLDAEAERLGRADVQAFETEGLIGAGAASSVLAYLFHRVEARLDGRPTLLIIDEGWLALDDPTFGAQLREWLKTLRKKNAAVVFATQYRAREIPDGVLFLTAGIDVQKSRLVYVIRGWGVRQESWLIEHGELWGETEHHGVWTDLAELLHQPVGDLMIRRAFIDSGFRPGKRDEVPEHRVYEFCRRFARVAYAAKGFDHRDQPLSVKRIDVTPKGKAARYGLDLVRLDSDFFKSWVHQRVRWPDDQPGGWHVPSDATEAYCRQIVSEGRVKKPSGGYMWVQRSRENHYLDCEAMAYCGGLQT